MKWLGLRARRPQGGRKESGEGKAVEPGVLRAGGGERLVLSLGEKLTVARLGREEGQYWQKEQSG